MPSQIMLQYYKVGIPLYRMANKCGHTFTLPQNKKINEIFNNNVYFLNNTSILNYLIKKLLEVATSAFTQAFRRFVSDSTVDRR